MGPMGPASDCALAAAQGCGVSPAPARARQDVRVPPSPSLCSSSRSRAQSSFKSINQSFKKKERKQLSRRGLCAVTMSTPRGPACRRQRSSASPSVTALVAVLAAGSGYLREAPRGRLLWRLRRGPQSTEATARGHTAVSRGSGRKGCEVSARGLQRRSHLPLAGRRRVSPEPRGAWP